MRGLSASGPGVDYNEDDDHGEGGGNAGAAATRKLAAASAVWQKQMVQLKEELQMYVAQPWFDAVIASPRV